MYICKLLQEPKEKAIQELLVHLPLLHSGNTKAKNEYLALIPAILSHSMEHGAFIEESRELLSYSLIHPAITCEERSKFDLWLGHLDKCFSSNYHSPSQPTQGQSEEGHGQMPFSHQPENGNSLRTHMALSTQSSIGSAHVNGWNNTMFQSNDSLNLNGLEGHTGSHGNLYQEGRGPSGQQMSGGSSGGGVSGHMPLKAALSAPPNFNTIVPPSSLPCSCKYAYHTLVFYIDPSHCFLYIFHLPKIIIFSDNPPFLYPCRE